MPKDFELKSSVISCVAARPVRVVVPGHCFAELADAVVMTSSFPSASE